MHNHLRELLKSLKTKIQNRGFYPVGIGNCLISRGKVRPCDGYCYLTYTYLGKTTSCTISKAQYLVKNEKCPIQDIPLDYHVSHLCHNKLCIQKDHLNLEPKAVNLSRKMCITGGQCIGHGEYPQCRLHFRFVHRLYMHV